jgi:DNA-3-methyladenine glycosylase
VHGTTCSCARKKSFTDFNVLDLARALLGARLVVRGCGGLIIETEAYALDDPASHSFAGQTLRNRSMFGPPGHAYVYRSYGIHLCLNVVARSGEAVLIRALSPDTGLDLMAARRPGRRVQDYCAGPGKLTAALGIRPEDDGKPFDGSELSLTLPPEPSESVLTGPRIGISKATERLWRFGLARYPGISRPFPAQGMSKPGGASSKPSN